MTIRGILLRLHRWVGLVLAGYLAIAGLTGSIIAFHPELDAALNPDLLRASGGAMERPFDDLAAQVAAAEPRGRLVMAVFGADSRQATAFHLEPLRDPLSGMRQRLDATVLYADPATGQVLGGRNPDAGCCSRHTVMRFLYVLHYSLHGGRALRVLLGFVAVLWMLDCLVGFALTLPPGWRSWRSWKASWQIKHPAGYYRRVLDLHRAGGLWLWGALFVLALSGAYLNLRNPVFAPVVELVSPLTPSPETRPAPAQAGLQIGFADALALARAEARRQGWQERPAFIWHGAGNGIYRVAFGQGLTADVYLDAYDGRVLQARTAFEGSGGDIFLQMQLPLHSGRIAGLPGRIFVAVVGLVVAMLSVTGVLIWYRKRRAIKKPG